MTFTWKPFSDFAAALVIICVHWLLAGTSMAAQPEIVSVRKIWDRAPHSAFTDLARFQDVWFCIFREADGHVGGDGRLRVLRSDDGERWESAALVAEEGVDLRDPKLSITPDGRLMIVAGGSVYRAGEYCGRQPRVAFSADGAHWSPTRRVLAEGDWLWRVTWHAGRAYGVSHRGYGVGARSGALFVSDDGVDYEHVTDLDVPGISETTLRFDAEGRMLALARREYDQKHGWIGTSVAPFTEWTWHPTEYRLGGPNFIQLPDGSWWAGSRCYPGGAKTVLARFGPQQYEPLLTLPSGGDTSYPGLVWHDGLLWMSYYSSHEGKTSIYLATIRIASER